jgi:cobalamin-dependent methionine synthase I
MLRAALREVPLFLDCGDIDALTSALMAVGGPVVVNAVPLEAGEPAPAVVRLLDVAAAAGAGVMCSPRAADARDEPDAILEAAERARVLAARAGLVSALYLDCLAYPPASDRGRCRRSIQWLRTLRDSGDDVLIPLVAVGNVAHGVPRELRQAVRAIYAALAAGAGATALILPVEDGALMRTVEVVTGARARETPGETWLSSMAAAEAGGGGALPAPPPDAPRLREAWTFFVDRLGRN